MAGPTWLTTCGGDTVRFWDVHQQGSHECTGTYSPATGSQVNCVRWNHTNKVLISVGADCNVTGWLIHGERLGSISLFDGEAKSPNEAMNSFCFTKGSRYICTGGTDKKIRIADLRRKYVIKTMLGHTHEITSLDFSLQDNQIASVNTNGDLLLHSMVVGGQYSVLKDPTGQVLRNVEYSCHERNRLVTIGDDGTAQLWDITQKTLQKSWRRSHASNGTAISFHPTEPTCLVSTGLDKRLIFYDTRTSKPTQSLLLDAPLCSLALKDDGISVAAGTSNGQVLFNDVRWLGQGQMSTNRLPALQAHSSKEHVASLHWQHSAPSPAGLGLDELTEEQALLGDKAEDKDLVADPGVGLAQQNAARRSSHGSAGPSGLHSYLSSQSTPEPRSSHTLRSSAPLSGLQTPLCNSALEEMAVFSPLMSVDPVTPSTANYYDPKDRPSSLTTGYFDGPRANGNGAPPGRLFQAPPDSPPTGVQRMASAKEIAAETKLRFERNFSSPANGLITAHSHTKDHTPSFSTLDSSLGKATLDSSLGKTPLDSSATLDTGGLLRGLQLPPRASLASTSSYPRSGSFRTPSETEGPPRSSSFSTPKPPSETEEKGYQPQALVSRPSTKPSSGPSPSASAPPSLASSPGVGPSPYTWREGPGGSTGGVLSGGGLLPKQPSLSRDVRWRSNPMGDNDVATESNGPELASSRNSSFSAPAGPPQVPAVPPPGAPPVPPPAAPAVPTPPSKALYSHLAVQLPSQSPHLTASPSLLGSLGQLGLGSAPQSPRVASGGAPFSLQLVQRALEESLGQLQRAVHEDVQNLHLELIRQFHMQQMEFANWMQVMVEKQDSLLEEMEALRKENRELRHLY